MVRKNFEGKTFLYFFKLQAIEKMIFFFSLQNLEIY